MKKAKNIIKNIFIVVSIVTFVFALLLVFLSFQAKKENKMFSVFGYSYSLVVSPSMEPDIKVGDIIIVKHLDYDKYLPNAIVKEDVLVYKSSLYNRFIVHQLEEIKENGLVLKGVNNAVVDDELVTKDNFQGIVTFNGLGFIGRFLLGKKALIFLVVIVFLVYIFFSEILNISLKNAKKVEKNIDEETKRRLIEEIKKELENEI